MITEDCFFHYFHKVYQIQSVKGFQDAEDMTGDANKTVVSSPFQNEDFSTVVS